MYIHGYEPEEGEERFGPPARSPAPNAATNAPNFARFQSYPALRSTQSILTCPCPQFVSDPQALLLAGFQAEELPTIRALVDELGGSEARNAESARVPERQRSSARRACPAVDSACLLVLRVPRTARAARAAARAHCCAALRCRPVSAEAVFYPPTHLPTPYPQPYTLLPAPSHYPLPRSKSSRSPKNSSSSPSCGLSAPRSRNGRAPAPRSQATAPPQGRSGWLCSPGWIPGSGAWW